MNKPSFKVFSLITILALMLAAMPVQSVLAATIITQWTFEAPNTPADQANMAVYPNAIAPAVGTGNAVGVHSNAATDWTTPAGNGSADSLSSNEWAVGDYYGFSVSTLGYTGIQVSWDQTRSSTGPGSFKLAYSTDGITFTDFSSYTINVITWSSLTPVTTSSFAFDLSTVTAIDNQANVYFRLINTVVPGGTSGTNRVDNFTVSGTPAGDVAPAVSTTVPANGAANVAVNANIDITFSEPVNVTDGWFNISCGTSGTHAAIVSGGPTTFTLDPDSDFANSESCTITIVAAQVTDVDANDPPDNMAADVNFSFTTVAPPIVTSVIINEVDADTAGIDALEFVELYDGGAGNTDLSGLTVVFYNGNGDTSYAAFDLDGYSTNGSGYFVLGNGAVTPAPSIVFNNDTLQNGQDAVALYGANGSDFPNGTLVTTTNLIDAVVYDTADADDPGLLVLLNAGQPQVDENGGGNGPAHSNQRCPNGSGGARNTSTYAQFNPSAGTANNCANDSAPSVASTNPTSGATNIANSANIDVTFSENVNASSSSFTISCGTSGSHTATVSGGPTTFTLNPDSDFVNSETCTVTVLAAQIADQDTNDPPDNMAADYAFSFSTEGPVCTQPFTPTYSIQGSGASAAITGNVTTQGIVVGDFEGLAAGSGFYIQDAAGDGNAATSDGIFVFTGDANLASVGDVVRVTGFARERFNQTALNGSNSNTAPVTNVVNCGTATLPAATDVSMPFASSTFPERYEGMLVRFPQSLVIAEYFNYDRFGEVVLALPLAGESRPFTGTAIDEPGAAANARTQANNLRRITLDDIQSAQNPPVLRHPNGSPFSLANRFRGGDLVQNAVGVLGFDFSLYRILPTGPADYTAINPRPLSPDPVGGDIRVAAMNTLNFFVTVDAIDDDPPATDNPADNVCGGGANLECRGADLSQPSEFTRQRDKLLTALGGLDADVIGLNELENRPGAEPLESIVSGLPGYDFIETGTIGTDAIKVGIIYRPTVVTPVGLYQVLDSTDDPRFIDTRSRPALAQTFRVNDTGAVFTVVVNHLKSKGSACSGDPDIGDGQGNCNQTRLAAAQALVDWIAEDPTGSGDPDFLIMGDLNSYAMEDPIAAIQAGPDDTAGTGDDYTNLISHFHGPYAYSYTFDGQAGYLDHALASSTIFSQVTGAAEWHINSDEPDVLDYDTSFKPAAQEALYEVNQYRTSDHDAVVVGLDLEATPVANNDTYPINEDTTLNVAAPGVLGNDTDGNNDTLTAVLVSSTTNGDLTLNADGSFSYDPNTNFNGSDSFTYRANDGTFDSNVATVNITINAVNDNPDAVNDSATVNKNSSVVILIYGNDTDVEGDTLTVTSFTQPANGSVSYSARNRNFRYTPRRGFTGTDTFTYTISDGNGGTDTATVTITVQ